jgi:hypothetical protein
VRLYISHPEISKETCDSARREVLYSTLIEFGMPLKLFRLVRMCLTVKKGKIKLST